VSDDGLDRVETERPDPSLADLDLLPAGEVVAAVVEANAEAFEAVRSLRAPLAAAVDAAAARVSAGGRVLYVGAGASGRLAALDASEWAPSFGIPEGQVTALVAGARLPPGPEQDAAEDDDAAGAKELQALVPGERDVVFGVSASGSTPYVLGALRAAREAGALTIGLSANPGSELGRSVDLALEAAVGPEPIGGSTRLKAGTAQKLVLDAFSTAVMVRCGRTLGNVMTGMRVANEKRRRRAVHLLGTAAGCTPDEARLALEQSGGDLEVAIVMVKHELGRDEARERLDRAGGVLRAALEGS
jgi:N-acetylmuramic acid 6-phosphate etherase